MATKKMNDAEADDGDVEDGGEEEKKKRMTPVGALLLQVLFGGAAGVVNTLIPNTAFAPVTASRTCINHQQ